MASTYSVTEAQANLPALIRKAENQPVVITRREKVVGYLLSTERMESILETLEVMADPAAVKAIADYKAGKTKFYPLSILDEDEN